MAGGSSEEDLITGEPRSRIAGSVLWEASPGAGVRGGQPAVRGSGSHPLYRLSSGNVLFEY